jgi:hypothetical protein
MTTTERGERCHGSPETAALIDCPPPGEAVEGGESHISAATGVVGGGRARIDDTLRVLMALGEEGLKKVNK